MADIVYSLLYRGRDCDAERFGDMVRMAELWVRHLRGPGQHCGPIVLISNVRDLAIELTEPMWVEDTDRAARRVLPFKVIAAHRALHPGAGDRVMQIDIDALARHPIEPMFDGIRAGEMRVAPSALHLMHWQQLGHLLGRWRRRWYGRVLGWRRRLGVSSSLTACLGKDWAPFISRWVGLIERHERRPLPEPLPGDQAYLNYLYAFRQVPMRRYGGDDIHHLRVNDPTPRERIDAARVLHFPVPEKLERMLEWSCLT